MNDRKNIVVGLFVLGGLVILGTLIVWFEGVGVLIRGGYVVSGHFPSARGVRPGKRIHRDGIEIGDVRVVEPSGPARPGVWIRMRINPGERIPSDALLVSQQSAMGDLFLDFQTPARIRGAWKPAGEASDGSGDRLIRCEFPAGVDIRIGHRVRLEGNEVGRVVDVLPRPNDQPHLAVEMRVAKGVQIPEQAILIAKQTAVGDPLIEFLGQEPQPAYLPTDGTAEVEGHIMPPSLLPDELVRNLTELAEPRTLRDVDEKRRAPNLSTAMEQIDITARSFQERLALLDPVVKNLAALTQPPEDPAARKQNLWAALAEFQAASRNLKDLTQPPEGQADTSQNLWAVLAEFRAAAANLKDLTQPPEGQPAQRRNLWAVLAQLDETIKAAQDQIKNPESEFGKLLASTRRSSEELQKAIARADALLQKTDALVTGVEQGKGTLGKLVTDDELHRALVALAENLEVLIDNTNRLMTTWRREGILSKEGK